MIRPGKGGAVTIYSGLQKAAYRMASQAFATAAVPTDSRLIRTVKNKDIMFGSASELEKYIIELHSMQEGLFALTELQKQITVRRTTKRCCPTLDRIDSNGHYASGQPSSWCAVLATAEERRR